MRRGGNYRLVWSPPAPGATNPPPPRPPGRPRARRGWGGAPGRAGGAGRPPRARPPRDGRSPRRTPVPTAAGAPESSHRDEPARPAPLGGPQLHGLLRGGAHAVPRLPARGAGAGPARVGPRARRLDEGDPARRHGRSPARVRPSPPRQAGL